MTWKPGGADPRTPLRDGRWFWAGAASVVLGAEAPAPRKALSGGVVPPPDGGPQCSQTQQMLSCLQPRPGRQQLVWMQALDLKEADAPPWMERGGRIWPPPADCIGWVLLPHGLRQVSQGPWTSFWTYKTRTWTTGARCFGDHGFLCTSLEL